MTLAEVSRGLRWGTVASKVASVPASEAASSVVTNSVRASAA